MKDRDGLKMGRIMKVNKCLANFGKGCGYVYQQLPVLPEITKSYQLSCVLSSGVARLGHTGACALATRGHAPPMQVCGKLLVLMVALLS